MSERAASSEVARKKRQPFSQAEDQKLRRLVEEFGENDWATISGRMLGRSPRQCRDRWKEYLMPSLNASAWSSQEDQILKEQYQKNPRKWSQICLALPGRSETSVKNRWRLLERRNCSDITSSSVEILPNSSPQAPSSEQKDDDITMLFKSLNLPCHPPNFLPPFALPLHSNVSSN